MWTVYKNIVLVTVSLVTFTTSLLNPSVNVALPSIGRELGIAAVTLPWINNGWVLAVAAFLVPAGRLSDIYGRKKCFSLVWCSLPFRLFFAFWLIQAPCLFLFECFKELLAV